MKTICFLADASSPHTKKWVLGCHELNWKIIVISHWPGEIPGADVIVHPLSLAGFPFFCFKVRRLIRKYRPDMVHAHQFGAHGLYAWFSGCKELVISAWGSDILIQPKKSKFKYWLMVFLVKKAVFITSVSSQITNELVHLGAKPEKILTFAFGMNRAAYEKLSGMKKDGVPFIICSPRLHEPLYNIKEIITAFSEIAALNPHVELWIIGEGKLTPELKELAGRGPLKRIRFLGRLPSEKFLESLAASHVMISIPSSDGTPVTLIEGMAAGALPVVSELPVYHDWITDGVNGLFVAPDFKNLADVLQRSINDHSLREKAASMNRRLVKERGIWEVQFQAMLDYYKRKGAEKICES